MAMCMTELVHGKWGRVGGFPVATTLASMPGLWETHLCSPRFEFNDASTSFESH